MVTRAHISITPRATVGSVHWTLNGGSSQKIRMHRVSEQALKQADGIPLRPEARESKLGQYLLRSSKAIQGNKLYPRALQKVLQRQSVQEHLNILSGKPSDAKREKDSLARMVIGQLADYNSGVYEKRYGELQDRLISALKFLANGEISSFNAEISRIRAEARRAKEVVLDLSGLFFTGMDLTNVDLNGTDLQGAKFLGTNLTQAGFYRANLSGANLEQAVLQKTKFRQATLIGATFTVEGRPAIYTPETKTFIDQFLKDTFNCSF